MPKVYLTFTFLSLFICAKAIDTLTVRQVYSFNVGDTMDFRIWNYGIIDNGSFEQINFQRRIVSSKAFSSTGDTLFISFNQDSTLNLIVTDLDSVAIFYGSTGINQDTGGCNLQIKFDTTTYSGFISNSINLGCFEYGLGYTFTEGLGRTYYYNGGGDPIGDQSYYYETLVYYSNGHIRVGRPIEDLDGSNLPFIPLPEECATWTRTVTYGGGPPGWNSPPFTFSEQIQTGAKYPHNGYNYVEMLYNDGATNDSLIGYFYNDSIAKKVYFAQEIDSPVQVLCDFSVLVGTTCNETGVIFIDTVLIGNQQRAQWYCSIPYGFTNNAIIAGVGPLYGLFKVRYFWGYANVNDYPTLVEIDGSLSCFSVCGQTLYPNDTAANCAMLTGVQQINLSATAINLYPSINDGKFTVSWDGAHTNDNLQIFDVTGRLIQQFPISKSLTACQVNELSKGVYLWRAVSGNIPVQQGKFIAQ